MNWSKFVSQPQMPNIITLARLTAIPVIVTILTIYPSGGLWVSIICGVTYGVAALTDLVDGYIARKYHLVSTLGKFLDPLVDKLLVISALIMLVPLGRVQAWVVFLIVARELAVTGLRAVATERGLIISASDFGKQKTVAQNIAVFCLLWHYPLIWADTAAVGTAILYVALATTYWSGGMYFYHYFKAIR